jgi:crotonobetaine/carnitine-CoA ligase
MRDLPAKERTLGRVLEEQAAAHDTREFLNFKGSLSVSYEQLNEKANQYANAFLQHEITKNTKVAIMLPNCPEYLYSWFGLAKIGAVIVPVNTAQKGELLQYIIDSSDSEAIVTDDALLKRVREIEAQLPKVRRIFGLRDAGRDATGKIEVTSLADFNETSSTPIEVDVKHSDPLSILFTSGTTGPSKGVVMSHHYYYHAAKTIGAGMSITSEDILYTCLPLFHVNAQVCTILTAILYDARVAMYEHFSASTFWDEIRHSQATVFLALGAMGNILYKAAPQSDDKNNDVRLAMVVPPPEKLDDFESRFNLQVIFETFGMTEGIVAAPAISEPRRLGCCGKPNDDVEVRIVDDDDLEVGPTEIGEIVMRTREPYTMMSGYYKMPAETLEAFRNLWFHTGDMGYLDQAGYLYFVGRKKEAIRRRGENISAFEVEKIANQHPSVLETAAIAVPSELSEDDVKLVVVLRDGEDLHPADLLRFCETRMAYYMVPRYVEFRKSLPKTPTQRVEKYKLQVEGNKSDTWDRETAGYQLDRG